MLALIRPVTTSTDGRCVATTRWIPTARAICAIRQIESSTSRGATIIRSASSSITTTMYGKCSYFGLLAGRDPEACRRGDLVVAVDVAHADRREQLVAQLHLADDPLQRLGRALRVHDHRREQVRDVGEVGELDALRVDQDRAAPRRASSASGAT